MYLAHQGLYIPTSDVLNENLLVEDIWEVDPERAIALITTRELFFKRGKGLLGDDIDKIAGKLLYQNVARVYGTRSLSFPVVLSYFRDGSMVPII